MTGTDSYPLYLSIHMPFNLGGPVIMPHRVLTECLTKVNGLKPQALLRCVIVNRSLVWTSQALYWQKDLINLLIDMVKRIFRRTVLYHRHV